MNNRKLYRNLFLFYLLLLIFFAIKIIYDKNKKINKLNIVGNMIVSTINNNSTNYVNELMYPSKLIEKAFGDGGISPELETALEKQLSTFLGSQLIDFKGKSDTLKYLGFFKSNGKYYLKFWSENISNKPDLVKLEVIDYGQYRIIDVFYFSLGDWLSKHVYHFTPIRTFSQGTPYGIKNSEIATFLKKREKIASQIGDEKYEQAIYDYKSLPIKIRNEFTFKSLYLQALCYTNDFKELDSQISNKNEDLKNYYYFLFYYINENPDSLSKYKNIIKQVN